MTPLRLIFVPCLVTILACATNPPGAACQVNLSGECGNGEECVLPADCQGHDLCDGLCALTCQRDSDCPSSCHCAVYNVYDGGANGDCVTPDGGFAGCVAAP